MKDIKTCIRCKEKKLVGEFSKDIQTKDKLRRYCKLCDRAMNKKYHQSNLESILARRQQYRERYWATGRNIYHNLKHNGKSPITFTVSEVIEWYSKQVVVCHYCGCSLVHGRGLSSRTIDRRDNNKPYSLVNMVLCCKQYNIIKGSWFAELQMIEIAKKYFIRKEATQ